VWYFEITEDHDDQVKAFVCFKVEVVLAMVGDVEIFFCGSRFRVVDGTWREIDAGDIGAGLCQPCGVQTRAAAEIGDGGIGSDIELRGDPLDGTVDKRMVAG
jgi:hypothetical protein